MIEKIRAGFDSDFAAAWTERIGEITYMFRGENVLSYASIIKVKTRTWTSNLKKLLEEIEQVSSQQ